MKSILIRPGCWSWSTAFRLPPIGWSPAFRLLSVIAMVCLAGTAEAEETEQPDGRLKAVLQPSADAEDQKQREAADRFLVVLEKTPRRGTALDRLYGYHVEAGTLDRFVKRFSDRTTKNAKDGTAWMILGLLESQRGRDAAAVAAFTQAEKTLADNPLAAYYLGQSLVLVGQPEQAAAAFERAIAKKPPRADLLEMFQSLGRVYQRAQKGDQALAVWSRLEKLFPDDLRVQEQIATTLVEEGQHAQALPRFEALAAKVKDDYRAATYRIEAADLKVRLGQSKQALADFETLLAKLNPDNWLYRDVRRRIDEVFLKTDDQAGLAAYYEMWVGQHADDVEAMGRLARILAGLGRTPEAQSWLDKALKLAPSRKDLRLALIEQLLAGKQFGQAIVQYELLAKNDPNNPDILREWGRLILKDTSRPEAERKPAAAVVWRKLLAARPKDSLTATQVADLFRQSEMPEEALELYQKAVALSPDAAQYREYLGEYYHTLKRSEEALATWREIAAGKKHTAENVARLAEVLSGFGYLEEGVTHILEACQLDRDEFKYPLKAAELLSRAEKYDEALNQLDQAEKLSDSPENTETVLQQRIRNLQLADKLEAQVEVLQKELAEAKETGAALERAERWYLLARHLEAARKLPEADQAINKALELDDKSIVYRGTLARISESSGNLQGAADAYRTLASIDRRFKTEHLTNVAKLETQLGRTEQALQAGRDLLAAAPGNPENYEFFAQLCFQLGKPEDGLEALRRSVRLNPTEAKGMLTLAGALADQFRSDEAIELYWRAFEKSTELEAKLGVVQKLAELYLQTNHFDRLVERFERNRREANQEREQTICLAQAYQSAGDYGTARQELERLLTQNSRDTQLLQQLSNLAENEGDLVAAIKYQRQLNQFVPGKEGQLRLAQFLVRVGENEEAAAVWTSIAATESDPVAVLAPLDSLLAHDKREVAVLILERLLREQPYNWELLYRTGVALGKERSEEARRYFRLILALSLPDDEPAAQAKARSTPRAAPRHTISRRPAPRIRHSAGFRDPRSDIEEIRRAVNLDERDYSRYSSRRKNWSPHDFGAARIASLGWLYKLAVSLGEKDQFLDSMRPAAGKPDIDSRSLWDWYYVQLIRQDEKESDAALRRLSQTGDTAGQWIFLDDLPNRTATSRDSARSGVDDDETPPLLPGDLEHVLTCYRSIAQNHPDWLSNGSRGGASIVKTVLDELKRAGRADEEDKIYRALVAAATIRDARATALQLAAARDDFDTAVAMFDALAQPAAEDKAHPPSASAESESFAAMTQLMSQRGEAGAHADVLLLLDKCLTALAHRSAPAIHARPTQPGSGSRNYAMIWRGGSQQNESFDFPQANQYLDQQGLDVLRQAYEVYDENDILSDLVAHCRERAAVGPVPERLRWRLALADLHWWSGEKDQAVAELTQATEQAPEDPYLRLDLVDLLVQSDRNADALAISDSLVPLNHDQLQKREWLALRLAVRTGQVDRARRAGERLVGLRLDAEMQIELAARMRQLGMHDLADGILGRARRQAGNRSSILLGLMNQYEADQDSERMQDVAYQILRLSAPSSHPGSRSDSDGSRQQALAVLVRSGHLKDMIERVETQIKSSPESVRLFQALAELHLAAGDKPRLMQVLRRMTELRPDDMALVLQVARRIGETGKPADALDLYGTVATKDPALFARHQQQICRVFQQARKLDVLVGLVDKLDLRRLDPQHELYYTMGVLFQDEKHHDAALRLFRRFWNALPDQRARLAAFDHEAVLMLPEVYEFTRDALLPQAAAALDDPWSGFQQVQHRRGAEHSELVRLVEIALKQNRLPELRNDVQAALRNHPEWSGGKALLAVIYARMQRPELAVPFVEELLSNNRQRLPTTLCSLLGQELENHNASRQVAFRLYEDLFDRPDLSGFEWDIFQRLTDMYQKQGEAAKGRDLIIKMSRVRQPDRRRGAAAAQYRMGIALFAGYALQKCRFPLEAVRMFRDVFDDEPLMQRLEEDKDDYQLSQSLTYYQQALRGLGKQDPREAIAALLETAPADPQRSAPAFNLLLDIRGSSLDNRELHSFVYAALRSVAKTPELQAFARGRAGEIAQQDPHDLSAHILACLAAAGDDKSDSLREAVSRLVVLVERTPLEVLPPGTRANSRQRALAARQAGLWLVARECLKRSELQQPGEMLAARAVEASRRRPDHTTLVTVLREWGQVLFDHGNRDGAAAKWTEMLKATLSRKGSLGGNGYNAKEADPKQPASNDPIASPVTLEQFGEAAEIAWLTGKRGLPALSLRAVRDALTAGPPVQEVDQNRFRGMLRMGHRPGRASHSLDDEGEGGPQVEAAVLQLSLLWNQTQVPAADQFDVLAAAVLPTSRPAEIFLYATRTDPNDYLTAVRQGEQRRAAGIQSVLNSPGGLHSLGRRLATLAVRSGRTDELCRRIADRQDQPLAKLPALVLLAQLALEEGDEAQSLAALHDLRRHLEIDSLANSAELACHAALPALEREPLSAEAVALLELIVKRLTAAPQPDGDLCSDLLVRLARYRLERHEVETAHEKFKMLVEFHEQARQRNRHGSFSMSRNGSQWPKIAEEYLRAGYLREALDALQQEFQSAEQMESAAGAESASADTLTAVARLALELPPAERYALLKSWSIPEANPRQVRLLGAFPSEDALPDAFRAWTDSRQTAGVKLAGRTAPERNALDPPHRECLSTVTLLIDAARQSGQVDDLVAALHKRAAEGVRNAAALELATRIATGEAGKLLPDVQKFVGYLSVRFTNPRGNAADVGTNDAEFDDNPSDGEKLDDNVSWAEYLFVHECLSCGSLRDLGENVLNLWSVGAKQNAGGVPVMVLRQNLEAVVTARGMSGAAPLPLEPDLALWRFSTGSLQPRLDDGTVAPRWLVHEGHLVRQSAVAPDSLHFKYPLVGAFEFSVEVLTSFGDMANVSFGGLPLDIGRDRYDSGQVTRRFKRVILRSDSQRVQLFVDGRLEYDESLSAFTCPFLSLNANHCGQSVFRNLTLRGDLRIPREVPLTGGDNFDGWSPDRFAESRKDREHKPTSTIESDELDDDDSDWENNRGDESTAHQWWTEKGVIHAREPELISTGPAAQSLLAYDRPLLSGDSLRYEFVFEPGKSEVHPALGRLVFLLDPAGVRLHWLTALEGPSDGNSLPADNAVDEPSCRRGPQPLPLKPGEWNLLRLSVVADVAVLELNGAEIYRRPLETTNDRQFGLFRDPGRHGVRVRSVLLSGDWPLEISNEQAGKLLAERARSPSAADNATRIELIGESILAMNWERLRQRAAALPPADRYELLHNWVLPTEGRRTFRLMGGFSPTLPPPNGTDAGNSTGIRTISGGDFVVPALDLIDVARELNKLDELEDVARAAPASTDVEQRGRLAFLILVAAARGDAKSAAASLAQLGTLSETIPRQALESERWPELVAASVALRISELDQPAVELLDRVIPPSDSKRSLSSWDRSLVSFRNRLEGRIQLPNISVRLSQWAQVSHATAESLSRGAPPPQWLTRRGEVRHVAGLEHDLLYFQSPLRGDFEVTCRLSAAPRHDVLVGYAGFRVGLLPARDKYELHRFGVVPDQRRIEPELAELGETYEYRLTVRDGVCTTYINGVRVHEELVAAGCDPWLTLHSAGMCNGAVRDLRITGQPTIPESLELSGHADLTGWITDYYKPEQPTAAGSWKKEGGWIVSERQNELPGAHRQHVIRYHRPLLENGEIEYDFYYEPGKLLVHPALDRLTFLMEPGGVRIHWLTDAQFDRTGVPPDNVATEPANRRGPTTPPLKEGDWNRLKLALAGSEVTLSVNGVEVYRHPLEASNQRVFGLFHYAGETEVRVRKVTYRGDWPRRLPPVGEQELAAGR